MDAVRLPEVDLVALRPVGLECPRYVTGDGDWRTASHRYTTQLFIALVEIDYRLAIGRERKGSQGLLFQLEYTPRLDRIEFSDIERIYTYICDSVAFGRNG